MTAGVIIIFYTRFACFLLSWFQSWGRRLSFTCHFVDGRVVTFATTIVKMVVTFETTIEVHMTQVAFGEWLEPLRSFR